ncbi:MAG: hypothetical protein KAI69_02140 [Deltaproteobacteria bacterium]|nr:hypothetical protein [Deltaproteobacteria bacterium]
MGRLIILAGFLAVLFLGFLTPAFAAPLDTERLERRCTDCHDLDVITEKEAYMADWRKIVDRMVAYDGSEISAIDKLMVLKYINENLALDGPGVRARRLEKNKIE